MEVRFVPKAEVTNSKLHPVFSKHALMSFFWVVITAYYDKKGRMNYL